MYDFLILAPMGGGKDGHCDLICISLEAVKTTVFQAYSPDLSFLLLQVCILALSYYSVFSFVS